MIKLIPIYILLNIFLSISLEKSGYAVNFFSTIETVKPASNLNSMIITMEQILLTQAKVLSEQREPLAESDKSDSNSYLWKIILSVLGIIVIGGVSGYAIYYQKELSQYHFYGYLEYYDKETSKPQKKVIDLARLKKRKIIIGGKKEYNVFLRGNYNVQPIVLEAPLRPQKEISLTYELQERIEFIQQKQSGFLSSGDSFKIGSFIFVYHIR